MNEFRPGERLQRNWASMWLMSQEQSLWPERSPGIREGPQKEVPLEAERGLRAHSARDFADDRVLSKAETESQRITAAAEDSTRDELAPEDPDLTVQPFQLSASDDSSLTGVSDTGARSVVRRLAHWRVKLRLHRADLYLGAAVFVAALALLWPAAGSPQRAALSPFERALVTLGIAEAPAPAVRLQGDPGITVWVDPHTALYYCPGEEQYGKTADGRLSSQREAQMDRFEPAGRSACE